MISIELLATSRELLLVCNLQLTFETCLQIRSNPLCLPIGEISAVMERFETR